ncbi:MAG: hypothetical protein KBS83_02595 [Lachnospiraceae bacterium]|nr:hypothetical protein [Candidatus Equihabitans merdae]
MKKIALILSLVGMIFTVGCSSSSGAQDGYLGYRAELDEDTGMITGPAQDEASAVNVYSDDRLAIDVSFVWEGDFWDSDGQYMYITPSLVGQEDFSFAIDNISVNDMSVPMDTAYYDRVWHMSPGENGSPYKISLGRVLGLTGTGKVENVSFTIEHEEGAFDVAYSFAEDDVHSSLYLLSLADQQVLLEEDGMKATLISLGFDQNEDLEGVVLFENDSDLEKAAVITGVSLDRNTVEFQGMRESSYINLSPYELGPHEKVYRRFYCPYYNISDSFVESLKARRASVSLMLMTDFSENQGAYSDVTGGKWYSVELKGQQSEAEDQDTEGEVVFDQEDVRLICTDRGLDKYGRLTWKFRIENNRDENILFHAEDAYADGLSLNSFMIYEEVGAGRVFDVDDKSLYGDDQVTLYTTWEGEYDGVAEDCFLMPELEFMVEIKTPGGGKMIYDSDEYVFVPAVVLSEPVFFENDGISMALSTDTSLGYYRVIINNDTRAAIKVRYTDIRINGGNEGYDASGSVDPEAADAIDFRHTGVDDISDIVSISFNIEITDDKDNVIYTSEEPVAIYP